MKLLKIEQEKIQGTDIRDRKKFIRDHVASAKALVMKLEQNSVSTTKKESKAAPARG